MADEKEAFATQPTPPSPETVGPEAGSTAASAEASANAPNNAPLAEGAVNDGIAAAESSPLDAMPEMPGLTEEISSEDLDKVLEASDPGFAEKMLTLGADKNLSVQEIIVDDDATELNEEIETWRKAGGLKKIIYKAFKFAPHVAIRVRRIRYKLFRFWLEFALRLKLFAQDLFTKCKKNIIIGAKKTFGTVKEGLKVGIGFFTNLSFKLKLAFIGVLVMAVGVGFLIQLSMKKSLLPKENSIFISSLGEIATEEYSYDPDEPTEKFYDNPRAVQNIVIIEKLVVNLKPSAKSGPNPMAAFELLVEGLNPEVVIEVKDREKLIRDMVLRILESQTFEELDSAEGKQRLTEQVSREISSVLTTGRVKRVLIKTIILKN
jgi:flagellar basal body-associated protein FliL